MLWNGYAEINARKPLRHKDFNKNPGDGGKYTNRR